MNDFITSKVVDAQIALVEAQNDETGAGMVEYGLLVAGIAMVALLAVFALGDRVDALFDSIKFSK